MYRGRILLLASLLALLVSCSSSETPDVNPTTPTAIDSFGANPSPAPANIPVIFSWTVTGDDLTCAVDVDNNGTNEYTVQDCSSSSRIGHVYGVQGSFTAQLTVSGADGVTQKKTTPVVLGVENQAPAVLSFGVRQGSKENSIVFAWTVSDSGADTLNCRLDADGDGNWEFDGLCSTAPGMVGAQAVSSRQVEITLPTGSYLSIFEVYDAYSTTRISRNSRSPYNRLPQITSLKTTAASNLVGTVSFKVTDPDRDDMICSLTVEGIGQFAYKSCTSLTRSYTFPTEGTYKVTLEVIDAYEGVASKTAEIKFASPPGPVDLVSISIAVMSDHTCALGSNGKAYCWGDNSYGQLGDGTTNGSSVPVAVTMPSGVTFSQISVGNQVACALGSDGNAYCWGENTYGQLGDGTTNDSSVPVAVTLPTGVAFTQITANYENSCALGNDNKAYCWGRNQNGGRLGNGGTTDSSIPVAVSMPGGVTFTQIMGGFMHACALGNDGIVYCWGYNNAGEMGNGTYVGSSTPVAVTMPGGVTFTQIGVALETTCALGNNNKAYCWGKGNLGQMGNGTTDGYTPSPTAVTMPSGVTFSQISFRSKHACALGSDNNAYCWGHNYWGQLGDGTNNFLDSNIPIAVTMPSGVTFTQIAAGRLHTCAIGNNKQAYCWGKNDSGELGNGTTDYSDIPVAVLQIME